MSQKNEVEAAFSLLGIALSATEDEIRDAYHTASRASHPDLIGGDGAEQAGLNQAYEIAIAFSKLKKSVVPISSQGLAAQIRQVLVPQTASLTAVNRANSLKRSRTRVLRMGKWFLWAAGAVGIVLAFLGDNLEKITLLAGVTKEQEESFVALSLLMGMMGLVLALVIDYIERGIEDYLEALGDRRFCARELAKLLRFRDVESFSDVDLLGTPEKAENEPDFPNPFQMLRHARKPDTSILLLKAQEHELIECQLQEDLTPESIDIYLVKFKPSLFLPAEATSSPVAPRVPSMRDARSSIGVGMVLSSAFGAGTAYLVMIKSSWWALLTGFFCLFGILGLAIGVSDLLLLRRQGLAEKAIDESPSKGV